ncbi:manganese-dependent ADP-ribose/cdp-alcohol diphosphatase [Plakobranchus ocellatus]|uniref:Manganese-dependent ADP-ribose/cdp-alcohol diphosphatase n=1 Tax=Plakobranchus ocellatus TaxID=259542 RepID=A0AAV4CD54_9GAST|nr:manganese-dependent ADP-ribose/cdp-alcohol diphosphatase [Plakobranchus ocellatus]
MSLATSGRKPHITFGIVADVQYADCEDGTDFSKARIRYYRNSLNLLKNAINDWKRPTDPVAFVLQLGDLIDGKNNKGGEVTSHRALSTALHPFQSLKPTPTYHTIGNHDLYNLPRSFYMTSPVMNPSLSLSIETSPSSQHLYYTFLPHPKLRIVNLDTYEVSVLGYKDQPDDPNFHLAQSWIQEHNGKENVNDVDHLEGLDRRWAAYNGGVSQAQLAWLSQVLHKATAREENVIITTHIAIQAVYRDYAVCLVWNSEEILALLADYPCVIAVLAGHEHAGWDYLDPDTGVQHITVPAIIETKPDSNAYATAHLWDNTLTITGFGRVPSYSIKLRYPVSQT